MIGATQLEGPNGLQAKILQGSLIQIQSQIVKSSYLLIVWVYNSTRHTKQWSVHVDLLSKMLTNMEIDNAEVYRPTNREKMV